MTTLPVPQPLRALVAWPEPAAAALRRALENLKPAMNVTQAPFSELSRYLRVSGFYHVLHLAPDDWHSLTSVTQRKLVTRINLLVLGPDSTGLANISNQVASLYFPVACPLADAVASLAEVHAWLAQGQTLARCVAESKGRLSSAGGEPNWPAQATPKVAPPTSKPLAVEVTQFQATGSGIIIGQIHVAGDFVSGKKEVHQAEGDQIIHVNATAEKLVQQAGGDQVNINRIAPGPSPEIKQTAGGDQVNVNSTIAPTDPKTCPQCKTVNEATSLHCRECEGML